MEAEREEDAEGKVGATNRWCSGRPYTASGRHLWGRTRRERNRKKQEMGPMTPFSLTFTETRQQYHRVLARMEERDLET